MEYMADPLYTVYGGVSPEEEIGGVPVKEMAVYIGRSSHYYLPRFRDMDRMGRNVTPNLSALFFNFMFYFYRKMYLVGGLLLALYVICSIPSFLYSVETLPLAMRQMGLDVALTGVGWSLPPVEQVDMALAERYLNIGSVTQMINFIVGIVVSLFANRLYYSKTLRDVRGIRGAENAPGEPDPRGRERVEAHLAASGGVSRMAPVLAVATLFAVSFAASCVVVFMMLGK
jgi:hypothetical protein